MRKTLMLSVALLLVLSSLSFVMAKKDKFEQCSLSDVIYSFAENKRTGYETFTYFSPEYAYLGMKQFDADGLPVIDTFSGVCNG